MEETGTLEHTIVQGVFVGPARSGKNCLMERLLRRIPSRISPSTGVADSAVKVTCKAKGNSVISVVAHIDGSLWTIMDDDDQAIEFMMTLDKEEVHVPVLNGEFNVPHESPVLSQNHFVEKSTFNSSDSEGDIAEELQQTSSSFSQPEVQSSSSVQAILAQNTFASPKDIFSKAVKRKGLPNNQQHLQRSSLYLTNTGGQVEFQDVLPLLVSGPSIFFLSLIHI